MRLDLGLFTSDSLTPIARMAVSNLPDSIAALADSVTFALLRQVWRRGEAPSPSLDAALKTRSVPALRAFLEGERAIVEGRWEAAADAFARTIEADSAFWLAYSRYAYSVNWIQSLIHKEVPPAVTEAYTTHRFELPDRERLTVEAWMKFDDSLSAAIATSKAATERFPDTWFGWMDYADYLLHFGGPVGYTTVDSRAALERTLALNPRLIPAWTHLTWVYAIDHDTAGLDRAAAALERLGYRARCRGSESPCVLQLLSQLPRKEAGDDQALIEGFARELPGGDHFGLWNLVLLFYGYPQAQIALSRTVAQLTTDAGIAAAHRYGIAMAWAARGAWDSALTAVDDYVRAAPREGQRARAPLDAYELAVAGVLLGALDSTVATRHRAAAARAVLEGETWDRAELAWLDGMLAFARRDRAGAAAARRALAQSGDSSTPLLDRSLGAFDLELGGARRHAAAALAALEWERADRRPGEQGSRSHPYVTAFDRLAAAQWLVAEGDTAQAARLLTWHERRTGGLSTHVNAMLAAIAYLERARIEDASGHTARARHYYEQFLRRYDMPVPAHRHLVEEAQAALARLEERRTGEGDRVR